MTSTFWRQRILGEPVPARAERGLWTPVLDFVPDGAILKIEVFGSWSYADEAEARCGPDGDPRSFIERESLLNASAPVGALVAKIGGSTGARADGHEFVVGSYCVVQVPDGKGGPLLLAMNDLPSGSGDNLGFLDVDVYQAVGKAPADTIPSNRRRRMPNLRYDPEEEIEVRLEFDSPHVVTYWIWSRTDGSPWSLIASGTDEEHVGATGHWHTVGPLPEGSELRIRIILSGNPDTEYRAELQILQDHRVFEEIYTGRTNSQGARVVQEEVKLVPEDDA